MSTVRELLAKFLLHSTFVIIFLLYLLYDTWRLLQTYPTVNHFSLVLSLPHILLRVIPAIAILSTLYYPIRILKTKLGENFDEIPKEILLNHRMERKKLEREALKVIEDEHCSRT